MESLNNLVNDPQHLPIVPSGSNDIDEAPRLNQPLGPFTNQNKRKHSTETPERSFDHPRQSLSQSTPNRNQTISPAILKDHIVLPPNTFITIDSIEMRIQAETMEKRPGFQERIHYLNSLLVKARIEKKIRAGEFVLPEAAACSKVGIQPQPGDVKTTWEMGNRVKQ